MQKFIRTLIILLLLVVAVAILYTQAQLYAPASIMHVVQRPVPTQPGAAIAPAPAAVSSSPASAAAVPVVPASPGVLGSEAVPVVVKLAQTPSAAEEVAARQKDREVLQAIAHYQAKLAANALAHNFLLIFQAIVYFLTLVVIYLLLENVKKFADAAVKSAEAARKSAELAEALVKKTESAPPPSRRLTPNLSRKR